MGKSLKVLIALTLTTMLTGCGVKFGIESRENSWFNMANKENDEIWSSKYSENVNIIESMNSVTSLDITIDVSNVNIKYYDGTELEISGVLSKYSRGIKTERKSNSLRIREESKKTANINRGKSGELIIKVPKSFNGDLDFKFGVGEYNIKGLKVDNMQVHTGIGQLTMEDISFSKLALESGVGEVYLNTNQKTGEINVKGGIGEVNISLGDINGDLTFQGGMGSANIIIPENAPVNIKTNSGLGPSNISAKTSGENKYIFKINMGIGELNITN